MSAGGGGEGLSLEAWNEFCSALCERLIAAGAEIAEVSENRLDRDEGFRVLLRDVRMSIERQIEERDRDFPVFTESIRETYHLLADTPDYCIRDAMLDGSRMYRVRGQLGLAESVGFTTSGPDPADAGVRTGTGLIGAAAPWTPEGDGEGEPKPRRSGRTLTTGFLADRELEADEEGSFELVLSSERPAAGVWLPMAPFTNRLVVREIYHSQFREHRRYRPTKLSIERIGGAPAPPPYSTEMLLAGMAEVLEQAGSISLGRPSIINRIRELGNGSFSNDESWWKASGTNPATTFQEAYWALGPDQALLIDVPPTPASSYWNLNATNFWMEALDFRFHRSYLNQYIAEYRPDGGLWIVLAGRDPGVPNWIDAGGHEQGTLVWRWNDAERQPAEPRTEIVDLGAVPGLIDERVQTS